MMWPGPTCDRVEVMGYPTEVAATEVEQEQAESRAKFDPTVGKSTNPKDAAATTRLDLSLWPDAASAYGALAMTEGDLKYGGYNFRDTGVQSSVYVAALRRHIAKWYNGEEADPKTNVPHLANAIACLGVLIDSIVQGNLNDDRPPAQSVQLYADFEAIVAHLQTIFPRRTPRFREKQEV